MFFIISFQCKLPHELAPTIKKAVVKARSLDEAQKKLKTEFYTKYPDYSKDPHSFRFVKSVVTNAYFLIIN